MDDFALIRTMFTDNNIKINDKLHHNNKLYVLYNKNIENNFVYLIIIDLFDYKIINKYKYSGYTSCFYNEYYAILNDYNKINLYNINDNTFNNNIVINYSEYYIYKQSEVVKKVNDNDIKNYIYNTINIKLFNINNNLYICNVSKGYGNPTIIINISKKIIYYYGSITPLIFYKGNNNIVMVKYTMMNYYDINNNTLTYIYYKYNITHEYYRYVFSNGFHNDLFEYNEKIFDFYNNTGPIKISDTVLLYNNFIYNTMTMKYEIIKSRKIGGLYVINISDYININSSNIIDNNSFISNNNIFIYKEINKLTSEDKQLININKIILDGGLKNLDDVINNLIKLNKKYYQILLNNIINNYGNLFLDNNTIYYKLNYNNNDLPISIILNKIIKNFNLFGYINIKKEYNFPEYLDKSDEFHNLILSQIHNMYKLFNFINMKNIIEYLFITKEILIL